MERLNQWLTLVANFGVVIGIVFLAYEMRLNTNAMLSGTAAQAVTNWNGIMMELATNPELVDAALQLNERGLSFFEENPVAFNTVGAVAGSMFKASEYMFIEHQNGNVHEGVWIGQSTANRQYIGQQDFMKIFWTLARLQVAPSYRDFMDDLIRDICSKQACPEGGRPEDWTEVST
jgi:hypothetical protein